MHMLQCEVYIPRTRSWIVWDHAPYPTTRRLYRAEMLKAYPVLRGRRWRIAKSNRRPAKTLTVEVSR